MAPRHLPILAAPSSTAPLPAAQVEIQLGHLCNNRCVFCVSGQRTALGLAAPLPTAPTLAALDDAAAAGARKVTFLGGEPTLQASLLPAIARAIDLGFHDIVLFTNGVKTARASYIDDILALGRARDFTRFEWRFSIQGGDEAAHDAVTRKPGSFRRLIAGLHHLNTRGQRLTANACINEHSYRSLPAYVDLARAHGLAQIHLDQVRPRDAGDRSDAELRAIMPRYSAMVPYFRAMLGRFDRELGPAYDINVGNFPFCLMPERQAKIHHDGEPTLTVAADGDHLSRPWDKYADKRRDKFHPPACARCSFRPRCNGVFTKYAEFHGVDEFVPVPRLSPKPAAAPAMKYRTLPGTDLQLPAIGLRGRLDLDTLRAALDLGIDWFEPEGDALRALGSRRHELVCSATLDCAAPAALTLALDAHLRRLALDTLPLVHLRWPDHPRTANLPSTAEALATLERLRDAGKLTHIALDLPAHPVLPSLATLATFTALACLRVSASPAVPLAPALRDMSIGTGPNGQLRPPLGLLARTSLALQPALDPRTRALTVMAARLRLPVAPLALAWVLRQPGVTVAQLDLHARPQLHAAVQALALLDQPHLWRPPPSPPA